MSALFSLKLWRGLSHRKQEPSQPVRVSGERLGEDLERHLPVELGLGGLVDLPHAPLADEGGHVVGAESGAGSESHVATEYRGEL